MEGSRSKRPTIASNDNGAFARSDNSTYFFYAHVVDTIEISFCRAFWSIGRKT
jgi:hypothetical protein